MLKSCLMSPCAEELSNPKKLAKKVSFACDDFLDIMTEVSKNTDKNGSQSSVLDTTLFPSQVPSMITALQSLDSLSEQILQFIITSASGNLKSGGNLDRKLIESSTLLPQQGDAIYSSLTLMRRLLMDAQSELKKMVENNIRQASHINGTIKSTNQKVNSLREELNLANEELKELSNAKNSNSHIQDSQIKGMEEKNQLLIINNRQLEKEIANLKQQLLNNDNRNKEQSEVLLSDRSRLKADKQALLFQIQEMQKTVDDKEEQLREFLREYNLQAKENEKMIKEANEDKNLLSKEKNDLIRKCEELHEVVSGLRAELVANEKKMKEQELEILVLRQASIQTHTSKRRSLHIAVEENVTNHKSYSYLGSNPNPSMRIQDPLLVASSPVLNRHSVVANGSAGGNSSSSTEDVHGDNSFHRKPKLVQHLSGSLSRAFKRTRNRKSLDISKFNGSFSQSLTLPRTTSLTADCFSPDVDVFLNSSHVSLNQKSPDEKEEILMINQNLPMHKWKADAVSVWLDLVLYMGQYAKECEENVKSGKILLGLKECEVEKCLNISDPFHRRKLCLAVDEFRNPVVTLANTSPCGLLDHWWVSEKWLRDVGLVQYASRFREHLIDGRILASLSRKDLERYLGMEGKKTHQDGVIYGVELLHLLAFNKQRLDERRMMCQSIDSDMLVWNNNRLIQWIKSIDLKEYSSNLRDSGVHGASIVLDNNFTSDDLASALGIPVNKATVRRHLASEFDVLVKQARESLEDEVPCSFDDKKNSFSRSSTNQRLKKGIRSSITRSFGRQLSKDLHSFGK